MLSDPIAALATVPGRSALALIRCSGRGVFDLAGTVLTPFASVPARQARRSVLHWPTGEPVDAVLYTCFPEPRSYTGEDMVEISTHGGLLVPAQALEAVTGAGARLAVPGEFTRRAVMNGKMDLLQAEATADLIDASSPAARRVALHQLDGGLSARLSQLRETVLSLQSLIAYDIDFPDEDDGALDRQQERDLGDALARELDCLVRTAPEGERLREGALCVIAGEPNVGKSSLLNALVGTERAIVTEVPGTTRDAIEVSAVVAGFPFRLIDTAGLRDTRDHVERLGVAVSRRYLEAADVILLCVEAGRQVREEEAVLARDPRCLLVRTKGDLHPDDGLVVSAWTGDGLDRLRTTLGKRAFGSLCGRPPTEIEPVVTRARQRAALRHALAEVRAFGEARSAGVEAAAAATHLTAAMTALDDIIGTITPDDVLDRVFRDFCIGK